VDDERHTSDLTGLHAGDKRIEFAGRPAVDRQRVLIDDPSGSAHAHDQVTGMLRRAAAVSSAATPPPQTTTWYCVRVLMTASRRLAVYASAGGGDR
jgi:hypothetical protein